MIEWNERYGIHVANVGIIHMVVGWSSSGYRISVNGKNLTKLDEDLENGKARAIKLAKKLLLEAVIAFDEKETNEK